MRDILITALIGIMIGIVDVIPMIKMKLDKHSIVSAFVFYFTLPFIIMNIDLYGLIWWLKGGIIGFMLALPVIIMVAKDDKNSVPPMLVMSTVLGIVVSAIEHFFM